MIGYLNGGDLETKKGHGLVACSLCRKKDHGCDLNNLVQKEGHGLDLSNLDSEDHQRDLGRCR